ncbi:putative 2OG-Fe(II) oxygenase [Croceibacterium sp. TMG7-5b_MA50]|uniref:putative 2OG-Fe(II) oxygenase n=1 Tax=Croceibacterium sp. TMG7-5b_MA50 TaxID=3121290 RepID=UPI003221AF67
MSADHDMRIVAPFSPSILKARMSDELVETLNAHADAIRSDPDEVRRRDWSRNLAGVVSSELQITDLVKDASVISDFIHDLARTFTYRCENALLHFSEYKHTDELKNTRLSIEIKEAWINDMVAGDYNPVHYHQGCVFSSVGFLALPEDYPAEFEADKARQNTAGCLQFIDSRTAVGVRNLFTVKPAVGDFYLWPSWMLHCVYPFRSSGIRRSVAINIALR